MTRPLALAATLAALLLLPSCIKSNLGTEVRNDGSAAVSFRFAFKVESLELLRGQLEGFADMAGEEAGIDEALEKLDNVEKLFDEAKLKERLKAVGIEVASASVKAEDGWKTLDLAGTIADLNRFVDDLAAGAQKAKAAAEGQSGMELPFDPSGFTPRFYKTGQDGVGELVLVPPLAAALEAMGDENPLSQLEDMDDYQLEEMEAQFDIAKGMFGITGLKLEMSVKLVGEVLTTVGCKKVGDDTIAVTLTDEDLSAAKLPSLFGLNKGVSATFKIPEGCKIRFADRPATTAPKAPEPAPGQEEKAPAPEEKPAPAPAPGGDGR